MIDLAAKWKMNGNVTSICLKGHVTLRSVFLDDNKNNQKNNKQKLIQTNPHSIHVWYIYQNLSYKLTLYVLVGKNIPIPCMVWVPWFPHFRKNPHHFWSEVFSDFAAFLCTMNGVLKGRQHNLGWMVQSLHIRL